MHKRIALVAIERLRQFEEVSKLVLYGSVSRGEERAGSDIDLALICDDLWKWSPSGIDSYPLGLFEKVNAIRVDMDNEYG
jgi:predicted nucleotidyltransferase